MVEEDTEQNPGGGGGVLDRYLGIIEPLRV